MRGASLVRIGWMQWSIVAAGLLTVLAVVWVMQPWSWEDWYVRMFVVPRLETKYGFHAENAPVSALDGTDLVIVRVTPGGAFDRLGVRPGDLPFGYHGGGWSSVHSALADAERGEFAAFDVVNVHDWSSSGRRAGFRTLSVNPRDTDIATLFYCEPWELSAPAGTAVLVSVRAAGGVGAACDLWMRDEGGGMQRKVHAYQRFVGAVWSPDGAWIALTDRDNFDAPRCLLIDARTGASLNLSELLTERDAAGRPPRVDRVGRCGIFGWVRGTPRVALTMSGYRDSDSSRVDRSLFFDTSTRTFVDAGRPASGRTSLPK